MAGKGEDSRIQLDLIHCHMKHDTADVEKIVDAVNNIVNPFKYEQNKLIHIVLGVVTTQYVRSDLQTADDARGESRFIKFCVQYLQTGEVGLFSSITIMNLKTFTSTYENFSHEKH